MLYRILSAESSWELESKVHIYISKGFKPQGAVGFTRYKPAKNWVETWTQSMIKEVQTTFNLY